MRIRSRFTESHRCSCACATPPNSVVAAGLVISRTCVADLAAALSPIRVIHSPKIRFALISLGRRDTFSRVKRARVAAVAVAVLLAPSRARAGNEDSFLYGDQASMTGGAVTASIRDTAAIWYNPAGLGL